MKKLLLIITLYISLQSISNAQKEYVNWTLFDSRIYLSFKNGYPELLRTPYRLHPDYFFNYPLNSDISDTSGNILIYYFDGYGSFNSKGETIKLNDTMQYYNVNSHIDPPLILKQPGYNDIYYIFRTGGHLQFEIINSSLNNGKYEMIGWGYFSRDWEHDWSAPNRWLTAIRKSNQKDYWLVGRSLSYKNNTNDDNYRSYLFSDKGIDTVPVISDNAFKHDSGWDERYIYSKSTCNGDKIATNIFEPDYIELLDFDNNTGKLSNLRLLKDTTVFGDWHDEIEFSRDGSKLYAESMYFNIDSNSIMTCIYQFDLNKPTEELINASKKIVFQKELKFDLSTIWNCNSIQSLKLALNGKIYVLIGGSDYLGAIVNPNASAENCFFIEKYFNLKGLKHLVDNGIFWIFHFSMQKKN